MIPGTLFKSLLLIFLNNFSLSIFGVIIKTSYFGSFLIFGVFPKV
jgi:ABC-type multidrug transport system permease subunit